MTHTPLTQWKNPEVVTGGDIFMFSGPSMPEIARVAADFKQAIYNVGLDICKEFLDRNEMPYPQYNVGPVPHAVNKWQATGLQVQNRVWVNLAKCSTPRFVQSRNWSWPGYKVDKTPAGVVAHETGHYVVWRMRQDFAAGICACPPMVGWSRVISNERKLSGYEPTAEESFAEAMRVYILNPDLLRCGWPLRYEFIAQELGLYRAHNHTWRDVLSHAPAHIVRQVEKII